MPAVFFKGRYTMQTKVFKVKIAPPFDFDGALAAIEKIQKGLGELAAVIRKKVKREALRKRK